MNGISHWVRIAGARHGSVPLVIIHGGPGGNNYNFERTIGPRLESFATVIYYEQRGSGRSEAPPVPTAYSMALLVSDLDTLRDALGVKKMILLGYSFGGQIALEYAPAHPDHVAGLILEAASDDLFGERTAITQLAGFGIVAKGDLRNDIARIAETTEATTQKVAEIWDIADSDTVDRLLFHNADVARMNRRLWEQSHITNTGDMMSALRAEAPRHPSLMQAISSMHLPTIVLVGLFDHNVGVDSNRDIASSIPNAQPVVFDKSGHFPDMEEPGKFAGVVSAFYRHIHR